MSIENDRAYSHESGYEPYCMMCRTMKRMKLKVYGWKCQGYCGNEIDKNKVRRAELPLNDSWPMLHNKEYVWRFGLL